MSSAFICVPVRTPVGRFLQALSSISAPSLAAACIKENLVRAQMSPQEIDEVILGQVVSAGVGQAPARQAALQAGLPPSIAALTINKVCGSGLKSVMLADQAIRAGDVRAVIAGGMENMSQMPYLLPRVRGGWKFGHRQSEDSLLKDGLWCAYEDVVMGELAERTAQKFDIDRSAQDAFAAASHAKAVAAAENGRFRNQIIPIELPRGNPKPLMDCDEGPRRDTTPDSLAGLKPAFSADGTVTAGNASQLSDGAATVLVCNEDAASGVASGPIARIVATATSGLEPGELFMAPVPAIRDVADKAGWSLEQVELFEINEAFAAQVLAGQKQLEIPSEKINIHGGAIALGHPLGASGARVLVTLLHALADTNQTTGIAALCLGGGNAVAIAVERIR